MRRFLMWSALGCASVLLTGCPKGDPNFHAGKQAEAIQDYDTALVEYQRALRADPTNLEYKIKVTHLKFMDAQFHVDQGKEGAGSRRFADGAGGIPEGAGRGSIERHGAAASEST